MVVTMVITFIMTYILRQVKALNKIEPALDDDDLSDLATVGAGVGASAPAAVTASVMDKGTGTVTEEMIYAPVAGEVIAIDQVNDPVFSKKMMGDGFAIRPTANEIYAPVYGKVVSVFETKHAIGITTATGAEVLVHMGLDTVELKGAPFDVKVKEGDQVTPETLLAVMDLTAVKASGKETDVLVVFTNGEKIDSVTLDMTGAVKEKSRIGHAEVLS